MDTAIERLATDCAMPTEWVRNALDGMVYQNWLVVQRHNVSVDRDTIRQLPEHARITLVLDWARLDDGHDEEIDDENPELSEIRWTASPWAVYRSVSQNPQISQGALKVISHFPFRAKKPDGGMFVSCLDELAVGYGTSINDAVSSLYELEQACLLRWDNDHQRAEILNPDRPVGGRISKAIQPDLGQVWYGLDQS